MRQGQRPVSKLPDPEAHPGARRLRRRRTPSAWAASWAAPSPGCAVSFKVCSAAYHPSVQAAQAAHAKRLGSKRGSILSRLGAGEFQSSTKIEALREVLADMLAKDPSAKAIVFSQFTSMLDLTAFRLDQVRALEGFKCRGTRWHPSVLADLLAETSAPRPSSSPSPHPCWT